MLKPVEYKQGDYTFLIQRIPPFESMKVLGDLQKIIAPILGGVAEGATKVNLDAGADNLKQIVSTLAPVLCGIAENLPKHLDGESLEKVVRLLVNAEYVGYRDSKGQMLKCSESVIDELFEGRPFDLLALAMNVFKANYLDFSKLSSIPAGVREVLDEMKSAFAGQSQMN